MLTFVVKHVLIHAFISVKVCTFESVKALEENHLNEEDYSHLAFGLSL